MFHLVKFLTLSQDVSNNGCLKQLNVFSLKSHLYTHFSISSVRVGSCLSIDKSILNIALLKLLFKMQLVMLSIAEAVCLVTFTGYCWYYTKFKHQIYKILIFFVHFNVEEVNIKISCKEKSFVNCNTI